MSEEKYCVLGKVPKAFSYIKDGNYVHAVCRLKDDVDCFQLNNFFNMVYSIKLDIWDINFLNSNYNTADLIKCFHLILEESNFINLKELYNLMGNYDEEYNHPIISVIRCFFDMFDIVEDMIVSFDNMNDIKLVLVNASSGGYKEVEGIFYNSKVIYSIFEKSKVKVKKQSLGSI